MEEMLDKKVELKFVVDIVGHDEATIIQMYNDWLASPFNYRNNNSSQLDCVVEVILKDTPELKIIDKPGQWIEINGIRYTYALLQALNC